MIPINRFIVIIITLSLLCCTLALTAFAAEIPNMELDYTGDGSFANYECPAAMIETGKTYVLDIGIGGVPAASGEIVFEDVSVDMDFPEGTVFMGSMYVASFRYDVMYMDDGVAPALGVTVMENDIPCTNFAAGGTMSVTLTAVNPPVELNIFDGLLDALDYVLSWLGAVLDALLSGNGSMHALWALAMVGIAFGVIRMGLGYIKSFTWGF